MARPRRGCTRAAAGRGDAPRPRAADRVPGAGALVVKSQAAPLRLRADSGPRRGAPAPRAPEAGVA